jgi:hypothetical protein
MPDKPLDDRAVYDLLHEAQLLLVNKVVMTTHARDVLSMAIRDLAIMQTALLSLSERGNPQNETVS